MYSILSSECAPQYLDELRRKFEAEWGHIDPFENRDLSIPKPIIALDEEPYLVGGLAFTAAADPTEDRLTVWINALFVDPQNRRQGIATLLLEEAEKAVADLGFSKLYAYTDVPSLYVKRSWVPHESSDNNTVSKEL